LMPRGTYATADCISVAPRPASTRTRRPPVPLGKWNLSAGALAVHLTTSRGTPTARVFRPSSAATTCTSQRAHRH
jgi:hypothetical protein